MATISTPPELLGIVATQLQGPLYHVLRYYRGAHPQLGTIITDGYTGLETIEEATVIRPLYSLVVIIDHETRDT